MTVHFITRIVCVATVNLPPLMHRVPLVCVPIPGESAWVDRSSGSGSGSDHHCSVPDSGCSGREGEEGDCSGSSKKRRTAAAFMETTLSGGPCSALFCSALFCFVLLSWVQLHWDFKYCGVIVMILWCYCDDIVMILC